VSTNNSYLIFFYRLSTIIYPFFYDIIIMATCFWAIFKRSFNNTRLLYTRRSDARFINNEQAQNLLHLTTEGKYSPGHPVIGETTSIGYRADGYVTHDQKVKLEILP
jgi:hypothetical protein